MQVLLEDGKAVDTAPVGTWPTAKEWAESLIRFNSFSDSAWTVESHTDATAVIVISGDAYTYHMITDDIRARAIKMIEDATIECQPVQMHGPSGTHDIDEVEAIEAVTQTDKVTISGGDIILGDGTVCITTDSQE